MLFGSDVPQPRCSLCLVGLLGEAGGASSSTSHRQDEEAAPGMGSTALLKPSALIQVLQDQAQP